MRNQPPAPSGLGGARPIRVTLAEQTAQILRERIVWGELPPSSRLVETELADELGVSRTPVREALQRLELDGLVVRQGASLLVAPFDQEVAVETLLMRQLLEPFAAEESVAKMRPADIDELRSVLREMKAGLDEKRPNPKRGAELNIEFHNLLNSHCPYRRIVEAIQVARDAYSALRLYSSYSADDLRRVHDEHVAIVDAASAAVTAKGTAKAVGELIAEHMKAAREALLRNTSPGDGVD